MHWLQALDISLFRFINSKLANAFFDVLMPFVSGNAFFYPILLLTAVLLIWKGKLRGMLCVALLALVLPLGDSYVCRTIKLAIGRPRPFLTLVDVRRPGTPSSDPMRDRSPPVLPDASVKKDIAPSTGSMPSSHAANWFAATMIAYVFYRRSLWFMLPSASLVSLSRIYNGVHYPSDVLAGAILGAGYAAATLCAVTALWQWAGRKWFPLWWQRWPCLLASPISLEPTSDEFPELDEPAPVPHSAVASPHATLDAHWVRLGYIVTGVLLLARLAYLGGTHLQLTGDEAYQWLWSKHLALSYFSKPPLIAYAQFLSTGIFGDTAFGVRFFSPVCTAIMSILLLRFFAREFNARAGFFLVLLLTATPLTAVGALLLTVDVFSVLFWALALFAGWRAVQPNSTTSSWAWVGLWMGLGFLSKYTELFQLLCWAVFFVLWPPARKHLRRPGPYVALLINGFCAIPVLLWNYQHHWVTVGHVAGDAKVGAPWSPAPLDFLGAEAIVLHPLFFIGMVWAAFGFWHRGRHNPRLLYLFSMGAPLFLAYFLYSFHSRLQPNWLAPSVVPLFCLMVAYWDQRWRLGLQPWVKAVFLIGLGISLPLIVVAHETELLAKFTGHRLPVNQDPLHRARGWKEVADVTDAARRELAAEGKTTFIIASHYRLAGELSFYIPEARRLLHQAPLVYCRTSPVPVDQFYFWPGYLSRKGENAVYVLELDRDDPNPRACPPILKEEFDSVSDLGVRQVLDHGRVLWPLQLFACRGLR